MTYSVNTIGKYVMCVEFRYIIHMPTFYVLDLSSTVLPIVKSIDLDKGFNFRDTKIQYTRQLNGNL